MRRALHRATHVSLTRRLVADSATSLGRAASRRRAFSSQAASPPPPPPPPPPLPSEAEVLWPIAGGAVLISGICLGSLWLRNDRPIQRMHGWLERVQRGGMTAENISLPWLLRVALAFCLTQLPADSLKIRQLRLGALPAWGGLLRSYDFEQQQIALGALCALLDNDAAYAAFVDESGWYEQLTQALPPLLHESSGSMAQPEIMYDTLSLGCMVAAHPMFMHAQSDTWLWERMLEQTATGVHAEDEAALQWACLAMAVAERRDVALAMLSNPEIKRVLVHLADDDTDLAFGDGTVGGGDGGGDGCGSGGGLGDGSAGPHDGMITAPLDAQWAQRANADELLAAYARLALHRLAQTADSEVGARRAQGDGEAVEEWAEPFNDQYLHYESPPLPTRPPPDAISPRRLEQIITTVGSAAFCALGGLVWGTLAGAPTSARARRPIWRSAVGAAAGAVLFEALMNVKVSAFARLRRARSAPIQGSMSGSTGSGVSSANSSSAWAGVSPMPPPYSTVRGLAMATSIDVAVSSAILLAIIQPQRAPLAFGGWLLGRAVFLSQEVELVVDYVDEPRTGRSL